MALIYQISLHGNAFDARDLTWDQAIAQSGCRPDSAWRDPIHKRPLLKGEFGCAVSHLRIWERIADSKKNGIILEEDAVFDAIDPVEIDVLLAMNDSVWLGYRWNDMGYWYNAHAYAITPLTARHLINGFADGIIPVDEWLPMKLQQATNHFCKPERVRQIPRSVRPSQIEGTEMLKSSDINMHIITVATEPEKAAILNRSAERYGVKIINPAQGDEWRSDMIGMDGIRKLQIVKEYVFNLPADDIVLFLDGYDTFFADSPLEVLDRFLGFGVDILFGAERNLWPRTEENAEFMWSNSKTPYHYLNSGCYIGRASSIFQFIGHVLDPLDDQLHMQKRFLRRAILTPNISVALDYEAYVFQNDDPCVRVVNGQLLNPETNCCPCIYHGNGGPEAKRRFAEMAKAFGLTDEPAAPYLMTLDYKEVAPDILATEFLSESQCAHLIQLSEAHGSWSAMDGDKFPAQEIRLKVLGLWDEFERLWGEKLGPIAEKHWHPLQYVGLRDAFTMRYTMDTQRDLGLHHDASLVTGSVKLNDAYEGAEVIWPRQDYSNINVPKGWCILFPGQVTHGHYVPPLLSGVKYSLTMWSKRHSGDN